MIITLKTDKKNIQKQNQCYAYDISEKGCCTQRVQEIAGEGADLVQFLTVTVKLNILYSKR